MTFIVFRLFIGGLHYIKLQSVHIRSTSMNLKRTMSGLHYLDVILTGGKPEDLQLDDSVDNMIGILLENELDFNSQNMLQFDPFIISTFKSFIEYKTQIVLNLDRLWDVKNKKMVKLLMNVMDKRNPKDEIFRDELDENNVFSHSILQIFKNVEYIEIKSYNDDSYSISMIYLLSLIKSTKVNKVKVINWSRNGGDNWIYNLWENQAKELQQQYVENNYHIKLNKIGYYDDKYEFLINKF